MSERVHVPLKPPPARALSLKPAPVGILQRKCACGGSGSSHGECEECKKKEMSLQRLSTGHAEPFAIPPIVHDVLRSPGQPLDGATRAFFEPRFGHDFGKVRVHRDAKAAESAAAVNAVAYTVGRDMVFGAARYAPGTEAGYRLLAHELTHVVQQHFSAASGPLRIEVAGEQGAARAADSLLSLRSGSRIEVSQNPVPTLARQIDTQADGPYDNQRLSSTQGQADGGTAKEACDLAKEDCKSKLNCPPERADVDKKCFCYKGGEHGEEGYTCLIKCRCKGSSLPVS
jgi:Domain of unknown function (DUF4157)